MEETKIIISLQLPLAAVTEGFDALRGSHPRRSSVCGPANHAIFLPHAAALFSLQLPRAAVTEGLDAGALNPGGHVEGTKIIIVIVIVADAPQLCASCPTLRRSSACSCRLQQ